jgi:hypothetical protein
LIIRYRPFSQRFCMRFVIFSLCPSMSYPCYHRPLLNVRALCTSTSPASCQPLQTQPFHSVGNQHLHSEKAPGEGASGWRSRSAARRVGAKDQASDTTQNCVSPAKTQSALQKPRLCVRARDHKTCFHRTALKVRFACSVATGLLGAQPLTG